MKYLALLKDSLLEAIDTKVFYVMIGLSVLVILLVACIGFTPEPVATFPERFTVRPLNVAPEDLKKLPLGMPDEAIAADPGPYKQVSIQPRDGAPDRPSSPLRFHIRAQYLTPEEAGKVRHDPEQSIAFIKSRFATVGDWKIFQIADVKLIPSESLNQVDFEVDALPTRSTLRVWPHEPNLFFGAWPLSWFKRTALAYEIWEIEDQLVGGLGS